MVGRLVPCTFYSHVVVQLASLQDFKPSWNSQVELSVAIILEWRFVQICVIYRIKFKLPKHKIPCFWIIYQLTQGCIWLIFSYMAFDKRVKWYFTDLNAIFRWTRLKSKVFSLYCFLKNFKWNKLSFFAFVTFYSLKMRISFRILFNFSKIFVFRLITTISQNTNKIWKLILIKITFWTLGQQLLLFSFWEDSFIEFQRIPFKKGFFLLKHVNFLKSSFVCLFVN